MPKYPCKFGLYPVAPFPMQSQRSVVVYNKRSNLILFSGWKQEEEAGVTFLFRNVYFLSEKKVLFSGNFIGLLWGCDCAIVDVFLIGSPTSICFFQIVYECRITFLLKCIKSEHVIQDAAKFVFGSDQRCFLKWFWLSLWDCLLEGSPTLVQLTHEPMGL